MRAMAAPGNEEQTEALRRQTCTRRSCGPDSSVARLEAGKQRGLRPQKRDPKPAALVLKQGGFLPRKRTGKEFRASQKLLLAQAASLVFLATPTRAGLIPANLASLCQHTF